jgi:hypothetical protein
VPTIHHPASNLLHATERVESKCRLPANADPTEFFGIIPAPTIANSILPVRSMQLPKCPVKQRVSRSFAIIDVEVRVSRVLAH